MKLIRNILMALPFLAFGLMALPQQVSAVDVLSPVCRDTAGGRPAVCEDNETNSTQNPLVGPTGVLTQGVALISLFTGVAAVIVITIAGFRMIIAQGDPESFGRARQAILFAIFGLILAAVAQVLVRFVLYKL